MPRRWPYRSTGKVRQLAVKNGRAGGRASAKARAKPGSSSYGGRTMLEEQAENMNRRVMEIYGAPYHSKVCRNKAKKREGNRRGGINRWKKARERVQLPIIARLAQARTASERSQ
jgi:hypothetical protein